MYFAACGWLMTSLVTGPLMVSLVQVAATLPVFLLAIPGGAVIDIVDKRRFLILGEMGITLSSSLFAACIWFDLVTSRNLLAFSFLVATGEALTAPAWKAIVSLLVPRQELPMAVAANSVSVNVGRAVGPALGGALLGTLGVPAPFLLNAVSNLGVIGTLARAGTRGVEASARALRQCNAHRPPARALQPPSDRCADPRRWVLRIR
jgi:MFS family permease